MYQKQHPLIISSKRNTTYLMPLNSTQQQQQQVDTPELTDTATSTTKTPSENPFPVNHIKQIDYSGNNLEA